MVKALTFKGDKKAKKRKRVADPDDAENPSSKAGTTSGAPTASEDDDSWVTADVPNDVSGPVLIVLPTEPATCLACDANGKVYASAIENFVDGDPATAEPHDVRQVFVANRVAGTESISLKGHHGRYVALHLSSFVAANIGVQISRLRQVRHPLRKLNRHLSRRILPLHPRPRQPLHLWPPNRA